KLTQSFGCYDLNLAKLIIANNIREEGDVVVGDDISDDELQRHLEKSWSSSLSTMVYKELLMKGEDIWEGREFCSKSNDLELFQRLSGSSDMTREIASESVLLEN